MAATPNHHRKLIQPPTNTTTNIYQFCVFECDPQLNPAGVCSADCASFCPPICNTTSSPPTPSPATAPYSLPPPPHHHHPLLPLPLKISLIFLLLTFIYTLYKFYSVCHRSRHSTPTSPENQETLHNHNHNHNPNPDHNHDYDDGVVDHPIWYIRTTGLNPSVINSLAIVKFSKTDSTIEVTDCSVCLSEFEEEDMLRLLPNCKHAFHIWCIDTWLQSHTNCPLCRAIIVNNIVNSPQSEPQIADFDRDLGEISLGVLSNRDVGVDRGSASGSSGLRIGGIEEDDVNNSNKEQ